MDDILVSAPGKVILHGEHSVVYGKAAIAASLNLRSYLRLRQNTSDAVTVSLPDVCVKGSWQLKELTTNFKLPFGSASKPESLNEQIIEQLKTYCKTNHDSTITKELAIIAFLYLYLGICADDGSLPSIDVLVSSRLPVSAGLGSSAAYSVCLAASLLQLRGLIQAPLQSGDETKCCGWSMKDIDLINSWAFLSEKIIHGSPSGIDNSVSSFGGAIHFQAGKITPLEKMPLLRILLINTRVPRSTKALVANVRKKYDKYPEVMKSILDSMEAIAKKAQEVFTIMAEGGSSLADYDVLQDLIDINQNHLQAIGVSHPSLESIVATTAKHGIHSKLTGAGGGGCAYTLLRPDTTEEQIANLHKEIQQLGFECWETKVGGIGVAYHFDKSMDSLPPVFH